MQVVLNRQIIKQAVKKKQITVNIDYKVTINDATMTMSYCSLTLDQQKLSSRFKFISLNKFSELNFKLLNKL